MTATRPAARAAAPPDLSAFLLVGRVLPLGVRSSAPFAGGGRVLFRPGCFDEGLALGADWEVTLTGPGGGPTALASTATGTLAVWADAAWLYCGVKSATTAAVIPTRFSRTPGLTAQVLTREAIREHDALGPIDRVTRAVVARIVPTADDPFPAVPGVRSEPLRPLVTGTGDRDEADELLDRFRREQRDRLDRGLSGWYAVG